MSTTQTTEKAEAHSAEDVRTGIVLTGTVRQVRAGEFLQDGDEYQDPNDLRWYPTKCVGRRAGIPNCTTPIYRRSIKAEKGAQ